MRRLTASLVLGLLLTPVACSAPQKHEVTIMVPWEGKEFAAFYAVVKDFEAHNPTIDITPQATRALTTQLDAAAPDTRPDLAVLPSVGAINTYKRVLRKLRIDTSAYAEPFRKLGMENGEVYAVPVKADVKSLIWYDAAVTDKPSEGWRALRDRPSSARWCLGLESGPVSGWPGADSIADILLAERGDAAYAQLASGTTSWAKGPVKEAWAAWGNLMGNSLTGASTVKFEDTAKRMAARKCELAHGSLAAMHFDPGMVGDDDKYTYVLSSSRALQVSADFVGRFTENPYADKFIKYLAGDRAQQMWVDGPGFALSADNNVTRYKNTVQGKIAELLRSPDGKRCFSAADAMDPDVSASFYRAVLEYANGKPLPPLLEALDNVQSELGYTPTDTPPAPLCN